MRNTRFMMGHMLHTDTEIKEEEKRPENGDILGHTKNFMTGIANTTKEMMALGANLIPLNLFWDEVFCIMATSKNYVDFL